MVISFRSSAQICPAAALGYQYQKTLVINHTKVGEFVINFPVLITLAPPNSDEFRTIANGGRIFSNNGYDIIFTDENYNKLDHQIERYDAVSGSLVAWVRLPILSNAVSTSIRILYSNSQITANTSVETVWNSSYKGVWHLNENDYSDATSTGNDGVNSGTNQITGRIAGGRGFNGTAYIRMNPLTGFVRCNESQTISIWARYSSTPSGIANFIAFQNTGALSAVQVGFIGGLPIAWNWGGGTLASYGTLPSSNTWHYYVYTFDGTRHRLYVDGVFVENTTAGQAGIPTEGNLGRYNNGEYFTGWLDEARYSTNVKTAGWITTEFNNQNDPIIGGGHFIQSISSESEYNSPSNYNFNVCTGAILNYSIPSQAGHTYTWTITGGTPASFVGNTVTVTWGAAGIGTIQLKDNTVLCDGFSPVYNVTIAPAPVARSITKNPDVTEVCVTGTVSATFSGGSGGINPTDVYESSTDGGSTWQVYTPGSPISSAVAGVDRLRIRTRRTSTGAGCTASGYNTVTWSTVAQPVAQTLTKNPNITEVCVSGTVSATFSGGSGGVSPADVYESSIDGGATWQAYTPGSPLSSALAGIDRLRIRTKRTSSGTGCTSSTYNTVTWTVSLQPTGPSLNLKTPNLGSVCAGQTVSAIFNPGTGGAGCSDTYQYRFDGTGAWSSYTPGSGLNTTGHTLVEIQGERSGCATGSGCTGTTMVTLASWTVAPQPTDPSINVKTPDLAAVCSGQTVSATFNAGSGGVGCSDEYQYSFDGSGLWNNYIPGSGINTTGHTQVQIQGRRSGCTPASGCTGTSWVTLATWTVNLQPTGPTLNLKIPDLGSVCAGQSVSATFNAGGGGVGCTDAFQYRFDGAGGWNSYTPGTDITTNGHDQVDIRGQRKGLHCRFWLFRQQDG